MAIIIKLLIVPFNNANSLWEVFYSWALGDNPSYTIKIISNNILYDLSIKGMYDVFMYIIKIFELSPIAF